MTALTPNFPNHDSLGPMDARLVAVADLPWTATRFPGIDIKVLMEEPESGLSTALFRWQPGAQLPDHEHVEIEQTYVIEGSFEDDAGIVTAGNYVWRPAGSRHKAWSRDGALMLAVFLKPNQFFDAEKPA